jgi:hypothetical protein
MMKKVGYMFTMTIVERLKEDVAMVIHLPIDMRIAVGVDGKVELKNTKH